MTTEDWPLPTAQVVGDMTYSGWSRIRTCVLRAAFSLSPETKRLERGNDYAAVGNARHKLVELVVSGRRQGRDAPSIGWVKTSFELLLSYEHARLAQQWSPAEVPAVRLWKNVARTKIGLARDLGAANGAEWPPQAEPQVAASTATRTAYGQGVQAEPSPGDFYVEVVLRDRDRGYWGRLDRLENRSGSLAVVDLKSGVGLSGDDLVARHRLQMLFYAGLVNAEFGSWPRLELIPIAGEPVEVEYEPGHVESVRDQAAADRATLNTALVDGSVVDIANPSVATCSWCPFQVVCPAFFRAWDEMTSIDDYLPGRSLSLAKGTVSEVRNLHAATDVVIEQATDLTSPAGEVTVTRLPAGLSVAVGDSFAVAGVSPAGGPRVLRAEWNSVYWPLTE